ncbi:MAG: hypothetical protein LBP38_05730 [Desulfovibrio sp.]|jgi:hypothetical protein|nr:hypothetical protein [Desulfovibrio sp.]
MARHDAEMFCRFVYSPDLSYEALLTLEAALKVELAAVLGEGGGEFIHFEETGDALRVQCVFAGYDEDVFHALCEKIAPLTDGRAETCMLFVDKDLQLLHVYALHDGAWRECCVGLPVPGLLTGAGAGKEPMTGTTPAAKAR